MSGFPFCLIALFPKGLRPQNRQNVAFGQEIYSMSGSGQSRSGSGSARPTDRGTCQGRVVFGRHPSNAFGLGSDRPQKRGNVAAAPRRKLFIGTFRPLAGLKLRPVQHRMVPVPVPD